MEESLILSKFDRLVESGLVLYDDQQPIIQHADGNLKVPNWPLPYNDIATGPQHTLTWSLKFQFVLTSALAKKPTLTTSQPPRDTGTGKRDGSDINTVGFEIGAIEDTHLVIANKFCFARPHLMLLTLDGYRRQYEQLDEADLTGAWRMLSAAATDSVAFYNCGRDSGCSRLHKHLQMMPLPASSFAAFLDTKGETEKAETKVPFEWFYRRFDDGEITPTTLTEIYKEMLDQATKVSAGRGEHAANGPLGAVCPHNMILTKRWMVVLPRRRGAINKEAGVNALGMLGVIAVATKKEIENWVRLGLTESLAQLGVPKCI